MSADLARQVLFALSEQGWTLAVAESLTGGLLTAAVVEIPGASAVLRGGVTAYATELKHHVLGVDAGLLAQHGPVHPEVAIQMARGVRDLMGADWGLSTTGVAGPGPQYGVPAGRAYLGVAGPAGSTGCTGPAGPSGVPGLAGPAGQAVELDLAGGRDEIRAGCVERALALLLAAARGPAAPPPESLAP